MTQTIHKHATLPSERLSNTSPGAPVRHRPRLGFVGAGWIGRARLEAVQARGLAEVVALADPSAEALDEAAEVAPEAQQFGRLEELTGLDLDGVVLATPSALHAEQTIWALEQGWAVFCQKPLARTAAETERVIQAAAAADRLLGVDFSYRYIDGVQDMQRLVAGGELGRIFAVNLVFHNAYGPDKEWFYQPDLAGGGCVMDLGIHLADLVLWMLDYPALHRVNSRLLAGGHPMEQPDRQVEDYAVATIDLASGAVVQLACSWKLPAGQDAVIEASFYGTDGGVALHNRDGSFFAFTATRYNGTQRELLAHTDTDWAWGGRAVNSWVGQLATGNSTFDPQARRLLDVARVLDAIYGRTQLNA